MIFLRMILCFFNQYSECSIRKATSFNTAKYFPQTNYDTSNNISPNHDTSSSLLVSRRWCRSRLFTNHHLHKPSKPSMVAQGSAMNKTFQESTIMLSSAHFKRFCMCIFVNRSVITGLNDVLTFFRSRNRIVLDTVVYPMRLKSSLRVRSGLFTA